MIRGGALSGPYHMHQMGSISDPPLSPTTSSSQARAMPFLMTTRCAPESSGQLPSGPSGPPFTFIPGDGFLSPGLDSKADNTHQQAPAAATTVNALFPSARQEFPLVDPSLSSSTPARVAAVQQMMSTRVSSFLSADTNNTQSSGGTSAESSQLSNGGRDGTGVPEKEDFPYNRLHTADRHAAVNNGADQPPTGAAEEWGGHQQASAIMMQQQQDATNEKLVRPDAGSRESESAHEHRLRSAQAVFLSEAQIAKAEQHSKFHPQQQPSEHDHIVDSTVGDSVRVYSGDNVAQAHVSEIFPSYNTNLMSSDSYNFPTGAELLGVPTQLQHSSSHHPSRSGSVPDGVPDEAAGPYGTNIGSLYTNQNLVGRLGYNTTPSLKGSWTNLASHQYGSSSLLNGNHTNGNLQAMSPIVGAPVSSLLSESLQDNPYGGHGEASGSRDGGSYFSPQHTQAEAMQLCLNPSFGGQNAESEPPVAQPGSLVLMSHSGVDQLNGGHSQEHFLGMPVSPGALAQSTLQAQHSQQQQQLLTHQGMPSAAAVQGYNNNWRNGGNELLFLPGSDSSTVHSQSFARQMGDQLQQQQQQAELAMSPYESRRSPTLTAVNQLHPQSIFQTGDHGHNSHNSAPGGILQGLSLSLSSTQPSALQLQLPNHHAQTHEADIDVFSVMSQTSADAKGKRVQESPEGRYNNGILSRFRPPRDDHDLAMSAAAHRLNSYNHGVDGSKHGLLLGSGTEQPYVASSSNASYGPNTTSNATSYDPNSASMQLKLCQVLLTETVCVVRKCERRMINSDHLRTPQRSSWTADQPSGASASNTFATFHASTREVMGAADSLSARKDFIMNMGALSGGSSPPVLAETRAREAMFQTHQVYTDSREELEKKKQRLRAYLDEVDRKYRAYGEHMLDIMSEFDAIAGVGTSTPYTALALQAMSKHFRCLRDALSAQLRAVMRAMGEQDTSPGFVAGRDLSSLRFADQQLRQQRTLQQLGMLQQHAWRPQRGLPERAVSVLRSWLFEHFLHPYPKDSDKLFLAKQTGLTRSQVSNWFINARVRLWKPMVEEMYLEEFNNSDEGGSGERKSSRERRRETEAMDYSDANIASSFSNGHTEIGTADKQQQQQQRITIACGGDGMYNPNLRGAHGSTQNGPTSNSLDFDADQRSGGVLKKARNVLHNPERLGSPIVGLDIDSVSPGPFHDPCRLDGNSYSNSSADHQYSQHQDILAAANGGRFAAYLGGNLTTYPGPGFVPGTASTNGGVSLTLGLRHSDGLSLPGAATASQQKYSGQGHPNSQRPKDHFDSGVQDHHHDALRTIDNVQSELPLSHLPPSQGDHQNKRGQLSTGHVLHDFVVS